MATTPIEHLLRRAESCRVHDLEQLMLLGELVRRSSELIHALQKERGASAIYLGSNGLHFADFLTARVTESRTLEQPVRAQLEHGNDGFDRPGSSARLYLCMAQVLRALDGLTAHRRQIAVLALAPQDAIRALTESIGSLLALGFEVANVAADPEISRALLALVNFAQAKEFAGLERATLGGAFSLGRADHADQQRIRHLAAAQDRAFRLFAEFAAPRHVAGFNAILASHDSAEVRRMRALLSDAAQGGALDSAVADAWYRHTTRRLDAMRIIEDEMAVDIGARCAAKLAPRRTQDLPEVAPVAVVVLGADPALERLEVEGGVGVFSLGDDSPGPMRSILDLVRDQSRRIDDMSSELESARVELAERKTIDRAKGLLMQTRNLSEHGAYTLLRSTAMKQNKRIVEIADAIVRMADILKA